MLFIIWANDEDWNSLQNATNNCTLKRVENEAQFFEEKNADAYFNLMKDSYNINYSNIQKPIFINSVVHTLTSLHAQPNVIRVNGWAGFFNKNILEISGTITASVEVIFTALQKTYILVNDLPGFITPKTIAMLINEAYFAIEDEVSTKAEIDIAMKLGTNYPYGPFEWCEKIGNKNIYSLLQKLAETDLRYLPATTLQY